ncbi:MAG: NYN domain-containing protein [Pseudonocardia sp.]
MAQVIVYVDGMNLYHGVKSKYGRQYLWLDLFALAAELRVNDSILRVRYFTTIVAGEPDAARRQETYLAALTTLRPQVEVARGRYLKKTFRCPTCQHRWTCHCDPVREFRTYEEKLTDVALGVALVKDAAQGYGDLSVLVTTDSDLNPAIVASYELAPDRPIILACPPGRQPPTKRLPPNVTSFLISREHLVAAQLPDTVAGAGQRLYQRPEKWC